MPYHVSKSDFMDLVASAVEDVPEPFAQFLEEVPIEVHDLPTERQRASLRERGRGGGLLLGLYVGRPRTQRSVEDSGTMPAVIYLFQQNIETVCRSEEELVEQVRKTVLHEIGHHFGMSEQDLEELGYG
jgi:predicted Zn-dependent protease with MMP-like domain